MSKDLESVKESNVYDLGWILGKTGEKFLPPHGARYMYRFLKAVLLF